MKVKKHDHYLIVCLYIKTHEKFLIPRVSKKYLLACGVLEAQEKPFMKIFVLIYLQFNFLY